MKKLLALFMVVTMAFSLYGCSKSSNETSESDNAITDESNSENIEDVNEGDDYDESAYPVVVQKLHKIFGKDEDGDYKKEIEAEYGSIEIMDVGFYNSEEAAAERFAKIYKYFENYPNYNERVLKEHKDNKFLYFFCEHGWSYGILTDKYIIGLPYVFNIDESEITDEIKNSALKEIQKVVDKLGL